ncbi:hypothetical protein Hamer_G025723 [Homarus americanus]|uniref:Uncharacterized protein n=1 Tax=Homarus americanus TaxID=6706 RepID=A0A8J5JE47_HOMAM|nr:hypothetical protein Hamer_G025723 [Homarus americanus]
MEEGNTNDIEDLEDEEGGKSGDAGETEQRKVTTQKLSLLLGVCTSLQEMIQDIESESGEREQVIGVLEYFKKIPEAVQQASECPAAVTHHSLFSTTPASRGRPTERG